MPQRAGPGLGRGQGRRRAGRVVDREAGSHPEQVAQRDLLRARIGIEVPPLRHQFHHRHVERGDAALPQRDADQPRQGALGDRLRIAQRLGLPVPVVLVGDASLQQHHDALDVAQALGDPLVEFLERGGVEPPLLRCRVAQAARRLRQGGAAGQQGEGKEQRPHEVSPEEPPS